MTSNDRQRQGTPRRRRRKRPGDDPLERRVQSDGNLTYFDDIRNSTSVAVEIRPDVSAVQRINGSFRLAHILSMFPSNMTDESNLLGVSVELGAFLAVQHFNARSGVVLPHLPERLKDCDVYFTMDLLDTGASPTTAVLELLERIPEPPSLAFPSPLGIVGAGNSVTSESLSIIGAVNNVAQTSCCATSQELDDKTQHPFFSRTVPSNLGNARAAALYYQSLGITHLASLHVDDVFGVEFFRLFAEEAEKLDIDVFSVSYRLNFDDSVREAVQQIKSSKRKFVFGMFYPEDIIRIADIASQAGIMGQDGYVWILGEGGDLLNLTTTAEKRPRLLNATNGMGWIALEVDPSERYNAALESFKEDPELQEYYLSRKVSTVRIGIAISYQNYTCRLTLDFARIIGCSTGVRLESAVEFFTCIRSRLCLVELRCCHCHGYSCV